MIIHMGEYVKKSSKRKKTTRKAHKPPLLQNTNLKLVTIHNFLTSMGKIFSYNDCKSDTPLKKVQTRSLVRD